MSEVDRILDLQRRNQPRVAASTAAQRIDKLRLLERAMLSRREEIRAAMWEDFRKPAGEVDLSEVFAVVSEARHARRHLRRWMRPHRVGTRLALLGSRSYILYEPKGVVLILSPWNFPFNLTLGPLVSALAAGNCAVLKPSEMTPHSSACMTRIVRDLFDESEVALIEGDAAVAQELLRRRFDHIFFTGSPAVGRLVMKAAAEHLTSVTLELGGKSPVIVDRTADLDEAAKKIAWGKFFNAGQTCVAPDYLLVDENIRAPFLAKLKAAVEASDPSWRPIMVNERHASRIARLIESSKGEVITGGTSDGRTIAPTIVGCVSADTPLMQEEIFGPVLPVLTYRSVDEAIRFVNERDRPLALYIFSRKRDVARDIVARTSAGGTAINHTLIHFFQLELPFGGVGTSGMGRGHGVHGFKAFSNARGVLEQRTRFGPIELVYPPYVGIKRKLIDFMLRYL